MTIYERIRRPTTALLLTCVCGLLALKAGFVLNDGDDREAPPASSLRRLGQVIATLPAAPPADTKSGLLEIEEEAHEEEIKRNKQKETKETKTNEPNTDDNVTFVFAIGIEGSGHHVLKAVFPKSPAYHTKQDMGLSTTMVHMRKKLYPHGLWGKVCDFEHEPDGQKAFDTLVDAFQTARQKIGDMKEPFTVMLNGGEGGNMYSYPTEGGDCRPFHYPEMDSLYAACDAAGVRCGHIYLYRDPYQVIHSTQRRHFNPTVNAGIKLYYSMLGVIMSQLYAYPERTLACWNFFEASPREEREDRLRDLFGWKNDDAFNEKIDELIRPHTPMTEDEKVELVPPSIQVYMDSMIKAHDRVVDLCRTQVRDNGYVA